MNRTLTKPRRSAARWALFDPHGNKVTSGAGRGNYYYKVPEYKVKIWSTDSFGYGSQGYLKVFKRVLGDGEDSPETEILNLTSNSGTPRYGSIVMYPGAEYRVYRYLTNPRRPAARWALHDDNGNMLVNGAGRGNHIYTPCAYNERDDCGVCNGDGSMCNNGQIA